MPEGMYYHAIYHQYRGDLSKALDLYSQSLKGMNTKTFDNALLNLFYTIALLNDSTIESKNIAKLIYERLSSIRMMPAQLLALYALNEKWNQP